MEVKSIIYIVAAFLAAGVIAFVTTPLVKSFAHKIGAIDVPKDNRRMHKVPIPRLGGLAIFLGFFCAVLVFADIDNEMRGILIGAVIIVVLGVIDDVMALSAKLKFVVQIGAALVPVLCGVQIDIFSNFFGGDSFINLGFLSIPVTVIWIVAITNAVNLIDGLDGLACGVSSIACFSLLIIAIAVKEPATAIIIAALAGSCIGFLPYNLNPAKIFMGDTGATFLGFILATISVQGLFKFYTVVSFAVPFLILGLPIFDTTLAIIRRVASGRSPMQADRGHFHHKLIDMGFSQKQTVAILYALSAILGMTAVVLTTTGTAKALMLILAALVVCLFAGRALGKTARAQAVEKQRRESVNADEEIYNEIYGDDPEFMPVSMDPALEIESVEKAEVVSDGTDESTSEIEKKDGETLEKSVRKEPVPKLKSTAKKKDVGRRNGVKKKNG